MTAARSSLSPEGLYQHFPKIKIILYYKKRPIETLSCLYRPLLYRAISKISEAARLSVAAEIEIAENQAANDPSFVVMTAGSVEADVVPPIALTVAGAGVAVGFHPVSAAAEA